MKKEQPIEGYWAYQAGRMAIWTVRSPEHQWPDQQPAFSGVTLDDVLLWMIAREIPEIEIRIETETAVLCFTLRRDRPPLHGALPKTG